jgi:hypothetical protein
MLATPDMQAGRGLPPVVEDRITGHLYSVVALSPDHSSEQQAFLAVTVN